MNIKVYNDGRLVFAGKIEEFLKDNEGDLDLLEEVKKLENQDKVKINFYHSGEWLIIKCE